MVTSYTMENHPPLIPVHPGSVGQERVLRTMKRKGLSALLVLLLMLLIPVTASADVIYPAPDAFTVGVEVNHLLATLDPGGTVSTDEARLPDGLRLETEADADGVNVYLRGFPTTPGIYDLLIRYNEIDSLCTVTILPGESPEPVPVALSVETLPRIVAYTAGETLDPDGLSLKVEMSDSSHYLVTEGYELDPTLLEETGTQSITVSYDGLICSFDVDVSPVKELIKNIAVQRLPEKMVYRVGDQLDPAGLMIRVYTETGYRDEYSHLLCAPTLLTEPGQQEITVSYMNESCVFSVQVLAEENPASIAVFHLPNKLEYHVGDRLDSRGLVLIETGTGEPRYVEKGFVCSPSRLTNVGKQEITVRFGELRCSFQVTVLASAPVPKPSVSPIPAAEPSSSPLPTSDPRLSPTEDPIPEPEPTPELEPEPTPEPSPEPAPEPSFDPAPEPSPEPTPEPEPTETPVPEPIEAADVPSGERISPAGPARQLRSGTKIVIVVLAAALVTLAVVSVYVFYINRSTREYFTDLFRKKR